MNPEKLLQDEAFRAELQRAKTLAEAADVLTAHGIEVTEDELQSLLAISAEDSAELDETSLESVAGGVRFRLRPLLPILPFLPKPTPVIPRNLIMTTRPIRAEGIQSQDLK